MANPLRGEVELKTPEKTYTMRMSINAIVNIENDFDLCITEVAQLLGEAKGMRIGHLRTIVKRALGDEHPGLSDDEVGEIIGGAGVNETGEAIRQAMNLAFPDAKKAGAARPPKTKQVGTGKAS